MAGEAGAAILGPLTGRGSVSRKARGFQESHSRPSLSTRYGSAWIGNPHGDLLRLRQTEARLAAHSQYVPNPEAAKA
jgi:hypothetical protein